ncbi:MAG: hypothetical protein Q8L52_01375 [bacterium]|nr:hypothetical protein [bacterium]
MNTKLIIWILGTLLGAIVVAVLWYIFFVSKTPPQTFQPTTTLPVGGSVTPMSQRPSYATSSALTQTMNLAVQNGSTVVVLDFIRNGVTIPDTVNAGRYLLAGNLGRCVSNPQQCQAAQATDFSVYYNNIVQSFIIDLTQEPIGQARLNAGQFMLTTLGLTQGQLCSLNYYLGVTRYVNAQFTGKNLGFSFCPGAIVLPK